MIKGPDAVRLDRAAKRLVLVENTVAKLLVIVHRHVAAVAPLESVLLEELRALREEFEGRKKVGIRTRRSTAGQRSPKL